MADQGPAAKVSVYMTREEREFIHERAERFGVSTSLYLRRLATGTRFRDLSGQRAVIELYGILEALRTVLDHLEAGKPETGETERGREAGPGRQPAETLAAAVEAVERLALELGETRGRPLTRTSPRFRKPEPGKDSGLSASRRPRSYTNRKGIRET